MIKIIRTLQPLFVLMTIGLFAVSRPAFASMTGSRHDFSRGWLSPSGEICIVCHTPHNAIGTIAPLWNHRTSTAVYTVYSSSTLNATVGQPSGSSKACLSCHDGTVAMDAYGGAPGNPGSVMIGYDMLQTDLSNDHPVSFTYDAALATADGGLYDPTVKAVPAFGGKTVDRAMLFDHKVECATCHDIHNDRGDAPTQGRNILVVDNTNSALCLTCHRR